jgi:hypothetical protein
MDNSNKYIINSVTYPKKSVESILLSDIVVNNIISSSFYNDVFIDLGGLYKLNIVVGYDVHSDMDYMNSILTSNYLIRFYNNIEVNIINYKKI